VGERAARQWPVRLRADRWCWAQSSDESIDEFHSPKTFGPWSGSTAGLGRGENAVKGVQLGRAGRLWQRNDGIQSRSTLR
jgi:hypothetical protein